jgi:phosphotransferase system enzyme I (PtsI)
MGPIYLVERGLGQVPEYLIRANQVKKECARFADACTKSVEQLQRLKAEIESQDSSAVVELAELLGTHIHMLQGSRLVRGVESRIQEHRLNAEAAVQSVLTEIADQYASIKDAYLAGRINDIQDVGARLIRNLVHAPVPSFSNLPKGCIIVAEEISPADIALMNPKSIGGIASVIGGAESHTAIMARSMGLPAVLGIPHVSAKVRTGQRAILDGQEGVLIVDPSAAQIEKYQEKMRGLKRQQRRLARLRELPAVTRDGNQVTLAANIELPVEVDFANSVGAQAIGLVRTEVMFMNRDDLPSEDEQFEMLAELVTGMEGKPVTIRTLDVGGEKIANGLKRELGTEGNNPALGLRAIRFSLQQVELFKCQLAAILRAGALGPIRILLPMIATVEEVKQARRILTKVAKDLTAKGVNIADPLPPVGVMIEVPAAALAADALCKVSDFFSIGTNDLTQYTLAIDRANKQVAALYDNLNPAVLRLIQFTASAATAAGLPVNICGEMAGDERLTALFLGLGLTELSMNAAALPRIKQRIRSLDMRSATLCAERIMAQTDRARIATVLSDFNELAL